MPLLEINQNRHICASVRLDEVTATQVDQYAAFIHASADDVVDKALNYVFSKDRDFQDFLKTPHAKQVSRTLRVRKVPSNGAAEDLKKPVAEVESTPSVRAVKACSCVQFLGGAKTVLRTGRMLTLHPFEGAAYQPFASTCCSPFTA